MEKPAACPVVRSPLAVIGDEIVPLRAVVKITASLANTRLSAAMAPAQ